MLLHRNYIHLFIKPAALQVACMALFVAKPRKAIELQTKAVWAINGQILTRIQRLVAIMCMPPVAARKAFQRFAMETPFTKPAVVQILNIQKPASGLNTKLVISVDWDTIGLIACVVLETPSSSPLKDEPTKNSP